MFCDRCGAKLSDGDTFCDKCGTRVSSNNNQNQQPGGLKFSSNYTSGNSNNVGNSNNANTSNNANFGNNNSNNYYESTPTPEPIPEYYGGNTDIPTGAKKSINKKVIIPAAIAGVLVVASGVVFANWPYISNFMNKTTKSPEKYLNSVVTDKTSDSVKEISGFISSVKNPNVGANGNVKLEVGDAFADILDEYGNVPSSYISWFENAGITYDIAANEDAFAVNLGLALNDTDIASGNIVLDTKEGYMYLTVPEISDKAIRGEIDMNDYVEMRSMMTESAESLEELVNILPDEKVTEKIINRYIQCVVKSVDDVEKSSDKLSIDGKKINTTKLTATINGKTMANILTNVLTEVKNDKDIKKIIEDMSKSEMFEGEDIDYDEFVESIDLILDEGFEDLEDDEESIDLDFYVDGKGNLVGFGFDIEGTELLVASFTKGKEFASIIELKDGVQSFEFSGSGKKSGNKKNGKYSASFNGMDIVEIEVSDFDTKKWEDGKFAGTIKIMPGSVVEMFGETELGILADAYLELSGKDDTLKIAAYSDEDLFAALSFSYKETGKAKITVPKNYVDVTDADALPEWSEDAMDFVENDLMDALEDAGVPSTFLSAF